MIEIKKHINKKFEKYECDFIFFKNDLLLSKYLITEETKIFPTGTVTYGFYWVKKNYISYSFYSQDNIFLASRYDICQDLKIFVKPNIKVSFLDLILDFWVYPNRIFWEDEKDVLKAKEKKLINFNQQSIIKNTREELQNSYLTIEEEKKYIVLNI
ncbi:MAG: hypothetical protein P8J51_01770 [Dehalococcoidia bacterium]|nr:hypothetical protein [Dehalococcoidia bacterium]